jgi:hypothetical protein
MSRILSSLKGLFSKKPLTITRAPAPAENANKTVVLAGHGSYNPEVDGDFNGGKVRLPPSVTLYFWCAHGETLADNIGNFIESHADIRTLPDRLLEQIRASGKSTALPEIVRGGEEIWNYRITYPSGLNLGNKSASAGGSRYVADKLGPTSHREPVGIVGDRRYCLVPPLRGDLHISERGVPIIALLAANWSVCDGAIIHFCACRSIRTDRGAVPGGRERSNAVAIGGTRSRANAVTSP